MQRVREYFGCGEEYNVENRESNIIFPMILRLFGRISSGEAGKVDLNLGKKIKI